MSRALFLSAILVGVLVIGQVVGQGQGQVSPGTAQDELHYNGNNGDGQQSDGQQSDGQQPNSPSNPSSYNNDDNDDGSESQVLPSQPFGPNPYSGLFPFGPRPRGDTPIQPFVFPLPPTRQLSSLLPLEDLFGSLGRQAMEMHRNFDRQFQNLDRLAGEGQDVSYFNRNGIAYVRTCTTKKLTPDSSEESGSQQVVNSSPENNLAALISSGGDSRSDSASQVMDKSSAKGSQESQGMSRQASQDMSNQGMSDQSGKSGSSPSAS